MARFALHSVKCFSPQAFYKCTDECIYEWYKPTLVFAVEGDKMSRRLQLVAGIPLSSSHPAGAGTVAVTGGRGLGTAESRGSCGISVSICCRAGGAAPLARSAGRADLARDARQYPLRADCAQAPFPPDAAPIRTEPGEDCLFLDVWAPAARPAAKAPVMVWIHGDGFVNGVSSPAF